MTDKQTTARMLLRLGGREAVFGILWALVIAVIGNIGLRYLNVFHAPEREGRVVWLAATVALVAIAVSAMLIGPIWLAKRMRKDGEVGNDR